MKIYHNRLHSRCFLEHFPQSLTCLKSTMKTLENSVEYLQSYLLRHENEFILYPLKRSETTCFLTFSGSIKWVRSDVFIINFDHISHFFRCFYYWIWTSKFSLGIQVLTNQLLSNAHSRTPVVQYLFVICTCSSSKNI